MLQYSILALTFFLMIFGLSSIIQATKKKRQSSLAKLNCIQFSPKPRTVEILTVATVLTPEAGRMISSFNSRGFSVTAIGYGCEWKGFWSKIVWFREYLEKQLLCGGEITVLVDAYDVLCLGSRDELLEKFYAQNCRILIGAEKNCYPDPELSVIYPDCESVFRYVNAGCIVGYSEDLLRMLSKMSADAHLKSCDQQYWTKMYLSGEQGIRLDYHCEIFLNLYQVAEDEVSISGSPGKRIIVNSHESQPCIIHGNGVSKGMLNNLSSILLSPF